MKFWAIAIFGSTTTTAPGNELSPAPPYFRSRLIEHTSARVVLALLGAVGVVGERYDCDDRLRARIKNRGVRRGIGIIGRHHDVVLRIEAHLVGPELSAGVDVIFKGPGFEIEHLDGGALTWTGAARPEGQARARVAGPDFTAGDVATAVRRGIDDERSIRA